MKRGPRPTPRIIRVLTGNPGKRQLPDELPVQGELGGPPPSLSANERAVWHEVVSELIPGVARRADRVALEMLVRLVFTVRQDPTRLTPAMAAQIRAACGEFGMTPSARTRLSSPPMQVDSKFAGLLGRLEH